MTEISYAKPFESNPSNVATPEDIGFIAQLLFIKVLLSVQLSYEILELEKSSKKGNDDSLEETRFLNHYTNFRSSEETELLVDMLRLRKPIWRSRSVTNASGKIALWKIGSDKIEFTAIKTTYKHVITHYKSTGAKS